MRDIANLASAGKMSSDGKMDYEGKSDTYIKGNTKQQNISIEFDSIDTTSKQTFLDSLIKIQNSGSIFSDMIDQELSNLF